MIIDQLPSLVSVQDTDEVAIERGTTTYKTTVEKLSDEIAQTGGVLAALGNKQDSITASGVLKGNGSSVSAATKGTDYGAIAFQVTLAAADWSSNAQTVSNTYFQTSGYAYLVEPVQAAKDDYGSAKIYADDVSTYGNLTFHCTTTATSDLTVNICRIVSANNKTINIAGGSSGISEEDFTSECTFPKGGPAHFCAKRIGNNVFMYYQGPSTTWAALDVLVTYPDRFRPTSTVGQFHAVATFNNNGSGTVVVSSSSSDIMISQVPTINGNTRAYFQIWWSL